MQTRRILSAVVGVSVTQPIAAEAFVQWVLQDSFAGPMPQLDAVGVTITDNVDPYEETKIRVLNGGHTCLAYLAALNGISDVESRHYGSLFAAWTTRSPEAATAAVDRVPSSHRATALRSIANRLPEVDPDAARSWITDLSPEDARQARPYYQARMRQLELPLEEQP